MLLMSLFLPSEVRANLIGRFAQTRWNASAMTSIAVWTTCLIPYMCRTLMGIPMINLSINAAFSVALIGVDVISLTLYLRGTHAGCNHPRPRPLTRLASSSHSTMMNPSSGYQEWRITQTPSCQAALRHSPHHRRKCQMRKAPISHKTPILPAYHRKAAPSLVDSYNRQQKQTFPFCALLPRGHA